MEDSHEHAQGTYRDNAKTQVLQSAQAEVSKAKIEKNDKKIKFAENSVKHAKEARDILEVFKKDLISFYRYYEFTSQIVNFEDYELEKLSIFAKHLHHFCALISLKMMWICQMW
ncbi:hypothetical protein BK411_01745 [Vibrio splendidus]|nr:hypothetical protein BK411_01745 [Vibrio splendidus]